MFVILISLWLTKYSGRYLYQLVIPFPFGNALLINEQKKKKYTILYSM